jgi:uncharacterized protein
MRAVEFSYDTESFRFFPETIDFETPDGGRFRPAQGPLRQQAPPHGVNFITLNVAHDCNMACPYCFAKQGLYGGERGMMTADVARSSVDWLLKVSAAHPDCYIRFLGGEPLLNIPVIEETIRYATSVAGDLGKRVHFSANTNGTIFTDEIGELLQKYRVKLSISIDGTQAAHDTHRIFRNGKGTYSTVVKNVPRLLACDPLALVNGTLTSDTLDIYEYAQCFRDLGFKLLRFAIVGTSDQKMAIRQTELLEKLREQYDRLAGLYLNDLQSGNVWYLADFYKYVPNLRVGELRGNRCGAGTSYVNIDMNGRTHLCHRFTSDETQDVGSVQLGAPTVDKGITRVFQLTKILPSAPSGKAKPLNPIYSHRQLDGTVFFEQSGSVAGGANPCNTCDIRHLCGGYCFHDGEILFGNLHGGPDGIKCEVDRHLAKITMWMLSRVGYENPVLDQLAYLHANSSQHTD